MKKNNTKKSKLLALLLSLMMVSTAGAAFASCTDADDSSSSVSSSVDSSATDDNDEVKDTGLIKNSDFETFNKNDGKNVIGTSVTGWTSSLNTSSSGSSASSKAKSGIVDTAEWDSYIADNDTYTDDAIKAMDDAAAIAAWDNFTAKDKLVFYEAWEERNPDGDIANDFEKYQKLNIIERDVPTVANPKTHWVEGAEGYEDNKDNTNILMIHNENPDPTSTSASNKTIGLAQKYSCSSTVTVPAGTAASVSVWVKTANLQTSTTGGDTQKAVNRGAYIQITHSVGAKSLDAYEVKNINTADVTENNGWAQYTFYLKSTAYADTTFSIVLGLGQGGGTDRYEYVNGYAFFDDIRCELISNEAFDEGIEGLDSAYIADLDDDKATKTINAYKDSQKKFALNFFGDPTDWTQQTATIFNGVTATATTSTVSSNLNGVNPDANTNDVTALFDNRQAIETAKASNNYLEVIYDNFLGDTNEDGNYFLDTLTEQNIYMLLSANGTAYTAESSFSFALDTDDGTTDKPAYMALSFFVKTSDLSSGTGAGVTLVNGLEETAFTSLNIYDIEGVKIGDTENVYDGWQKCFFFVELDEELTSSSFKLKFNYGPTDIDANTSKDAFVAGFAAFAGFESYAMSEQEYESVKSSTYAQLITLKEGVAEEEGAGNKGFDSVKGVPDNALEVGLGDPANYKGVYSDNYRVSLPDPNDTPDAQEEKRKINAYKNAGLLNKEHFADVLTASAGAEWLTGIQSLTSETAADKVWNAVFGDATQPLMIWNKTGMTKSYGFIGTKTTASGGEKAITLRVKTMGGAKASVYLIDADDGSYQNALSIGRTLTFWYDKDGNICTGDSSKKGTQVAFKLQSNGLYKANKNWNGYNALTEEQKNGYFANLNAYTEKDGDGNLLVAENGASHEYHDYTWNREAFYLHDGAYYTEDNGNGVKVLNLADLVTENKLTARYTALANKELKVENISTNGEWVSVTFYLNIGETAKNYRLEVWNSATKNGTPEAGLVAFDYNYREANFDLVEDGKEAEGADYFESVFSYFDSNKFVRYDASLDTEEIGNLYKKQYDSTGETEGVAYLFYQDADGSYNIFADYSLTDKKVTPAEKPDDNAEDSSSEETTEDGANVWLLASSIAVASVLLLAVISIAVRYIVKSVRKKKGYSPKKK